MPDDRDPDEAPDLLRMAILGILAGADHPLTVEEIADELGRLALVAQGIGNRGEPKRGH